MDLRLMSKACRNGLGSAVLFAAALGVAWAMVAAVGLSWDRALLVQILWLASLTRWHQPDSADGKAGMSKFPDDELYPQVVQLSKENDTLSITRIQRTFRIGYNRAAWLLEHAAEDGHVKWDPTGFKWTCTAPTVGGDT